MDINGNIEIKRILDILKSKVILIVVILLAFIMLGYMYSYYYIVPKYSATETLLLIPNNTAEGSMITSSDLTLNSGLISTYSDIAKQSRVLKQVIENLNLNMSEKELANKVNVSFTNDTYIIEITVTDENPEVAKSITEEISNVFLKEIKEIYNLENIGIVDKAEIPTTPYNIKHSKDLIMFVAVGMVVSGIIIVGIYIFDNTAKTEEDIEQYTEMKTLGKIPMNANKKQEIMLKDNAKSYVTECINTIRTNILYMNTIKNAKTILVTSCKAQEGKSWVSANIATSFAETNKKVLLIDADMRKGRAHKIFKLSNDVGLSNYLYFMKGNVKEDLELSKKYIKETDIPNLHILTNGNIPPNPSELLDSQSMKELIAIFKQVYDVIIVDAPPCMLVTDSIILSTIVDSTILVVNSEKTKINDLVGVRKQLEIVGGNIIGAILNKVKISGKVYSKSYYYGHTKKEDKTEVRERKIITVKEVIEEAKTRLEEKSYNIFQEEHKDLNNTIEKAIVENDMSKTIDIQSKYFDKIINGVSELKRQINRNLAESSNENEISKNDIEEIINKKLSEFKEDNNYSLMEKLKTLNEDNNAKIKEEIKNLNYEDRLNKLSEAIKNIDFASEIDRISEELKSKNYSNEFNKISEEIKNVKENFDKINYKVELEEVYNEIKELKLNNEKLMENIKDTSYIEALIKETNKERLTRADIEEIVERNSLSEEEIEDIVISESLSKEEIEEIVEKNSLSEEEIEVIIRNESLSIEEIEKIVERNSLSEEEIQDIVRSESLSIKEIEDIIRSESLTKEEVEKIVAGKALTKKEVQAVIQNERLAKEEIKDIIKSEILSIDYSSQFKQIEEMIMSLKDNYLELSNRLSMQEEKRNEKEAEEENINIGNIIDIKELKKEKQAKKKKRTSYSINEDITFSDLEETAYCVMAFTPQEEYTKKRAAE